MKTNNKLIVCEHCLMAIESREGHQTTTETDVDITDNITCMWCNELIEGVAYEI